MNAYQLKWLALITMVVDHLGLALWPDVLWLRCVGRLAMPIYVFLVVEGFRHTHSRERYLLRLCLWALISEPVFDRFVYGQWVVWQGQNILFGLALTLASLWCLETGTRGWIGVVLCAVAAEGMRADYGWVTVVLGLAFYLRQNTMPRLPYILGCLLVTGLLCGGIQLWAALAAVPLALYTGRRGKRAGRFWYAIYPLHMLILAFLR